MGAPQKFKISSALKDIIGRELITNDFVAVFELVKNSFDAHATRVDIIFEADRIWIVDDGKGMTRGDVVGKWLFVAYSAKRAGTEDERLPKTYRDKIALRRGYAGNKGIGRFSCDRLGATLQLYSKPSGRKTGVEHLSVDWRNFEEDAREEFGSIEVELGKVKAFPTPGVRFPAREHGTTLMIGDLREIWSREKLLKLKEYLAKLVNPFDTEDDMLIKVHAKHEREADRLNEDGKVNGYVGNDIVDILEDKTTKISVSLSGDVVNSTLVDRGRLIYRIEEEHSFDELKWAKIDFEIFFLNRSAKVTFTRAMGIESVNFGNVFLFLNGFRVFPIGEPREDYFGLDRRKAQGVRRYLGTRDILGRIDIEAPPSMFKETSSRDAGLISSRGTEQLRDALIKLVLVRLERYVVDVTWADRLDTDRSDTSGLTTDSARARVVQVVRLLAGNRKVRLLEYDRELVDTISERASEFERTMEGLSVVAERTGNRELLTRIEQSRRRYEALRRAEQAAREKAEAEAAARTEAEAAAQSATERAEDAERRYQEERKRSLLLTSLQNRDSETLTLLHHQVVIYATAVQDIIANNLSAIQRGRAPSIADIAADLEAISFQNSRILAVTRFATQANFRLNADEIEADLIQYMEEYVGRVSSLFEGTGFASFDANGISLTTTFRPIDIAIVVDNLISNARKAKATHISFECRKAGGGDIEIVVQDDGKGLDPRKVSPDRIFEKGYSGTPDGSGLGLFHATQVLADIRGTIGLDPTHSGSGARFLIHIVRPKERKAHEASI